MREGEQGKDLDPLCTYFSLLLTARRFARTGFTCCLLSIYIYFYIYFNQNLFCCDNTSRLQSYFHSG